MGETTLTGLMMDDYPLSLTALVERGELFTPGRKVVSPMLSSLGVLVARQHDAPGGLMPAPATRCRSRAR